MKSGGLPIARAVCAWVCFALPGFALEVPAKTGMTIRLKTKISTQSSKPQDPVEAVLTAPVVVDNQFAIPAGAMVRGVVEKVTQSAKPEERSALVLSFTTVEVGGAKLTLAAKVAEVDNARETVDEAGQINGILASETITGQLDAGLNKLEQKYAGLAGVLGAVKNAVLKPPESDIAYDVGVELQLQLTAPLQLSAPGGAGPAAQVSSIPNEAAVVDLVAREPYQTMAQRPSKPSDITNMLLIGKEDAIQQVFAGAGWSKAAGLDARAKFETFRALAEDRGYSEAPVSVLLLDGKPPDFVFEKLNNTFAKRHHLRVWQRPATFQGSPVWAVAATHDVGISFSQEDHTFIHKIDSQIDLERAKVVNDLIFTGRVQAIELVDRPDVPRHGQNATGDSLDTDGRIAVLLLQ
jgi:LssY-like putative type I secretion system component LssY